MAYFPTTTNNDSLPTDVSTVRFSDLDLTFAKNPLTNDITPLKNDEAVKRSVKNIVLTNFGEKKFQPFFGGNMSAQLFENFGPFSAREVSGAIKRCIRDNEPRVNRLQVLVNPKLSANSLNVTINFTIENSPFPITVSLALERLR
jgi:phage baseplate assembly protein W|tara:strand:+ start:660 stop:1094 length:435 start_codon:yes stop_codon:yes gene_type:complete